MNAQGMNVAEVRRMADELNSAAEEVRRISHELTSGLDAVDWTGPDADQFRSQWSGEMVPALEQIAAAVEELEQSARSNAKQQEDTSAQ
ncbi:WXG100 family type VII secretion target [Brachybacterium sp. EF45031]|nr:WXG100 family type VII secretion target [Brachybacterium sillae]